MDKQKNLTDHLIKQVYVRWLFVCALTSGCISEAGARVYDATIKPYLTISQIYSDNLTYGNSSASTSQQNTAQGGFVTEFNPGINIVRTGPHSSLNLNYRMQLLNYEGVNIGTRMFNQLQMSSKTEVLKKILYVDSSSTISQSNLSSSGAFSPDNIGQSSSVGYITYRTFRISPYWSVNFNQHVKGEVRFTYNNFGTSNPSNELNSVQIPVNNLDSNSYQESILLQNGKNLTNLGWRLNLNNQEQNNQGTSIQQLNNSIIRFRAANSEVSYRLGVYNLSGFVQAGYYDNSYPGSLNTNNGLYVTPGLSWTPSPKLQLAVGYGYNAYFINYTWKPSQRTSLQFSYRDSQVGGSFTGSNTGFGFGGILSGAGTNSGYDINAGSASGGAMGSAVAGSNFNGTFQHRTRTTTWTASYLTTTTTLQQLQSNASTFSTQTDINGNQIGDPTAISRFTNLQNLNNDVFTSKRATIGFSWFMPKTTLAVTATQNRISYSLNTNRPQDIYLITGTLSWRISARMSASFQTSWHTSEYTNNSTIVGNNGKTEFVNIGLGLSRQLSAYISANLQYNYYHAKYDNPINSGNILGSNSSYDTNRITASISIRF